VENGGILRCSSKLDLRKGPELPEVIKLVVQQASGRYECSPAMVIATSGIAGPFASGIPTADRIPAGLRHSRKFAPQGIR
jgi:hypothetical protein